VIRVDLADDEIVVTYDDPGQAEGMLPDAS
jgi:hypothetical protein